MKNIEELFDALEKSIIATKADLRSSLLDMDIKEEYCIKFFEQKNFGEFFSYLTKTIRIPEEKIASLREKLEVGQEQSRQFFHYFLLEFNKKRAEAQACKVTKSRFYRIDYKNQEDDFAIKKEEFYSAGTTGARPKNEDTLIHGEAIESEGWNNSAQIPILFTQVFEKIAQEIQQRYLKDRSFSGGSTAVVAHYSKDKKLTIANLGDSRALLLIERPDKIFECIRLTADHEPDDILEKIRIEQAGGNILMDGNGHWRVNGNLMISRSFGDLNIIGMGGTTLVCQKPDISVQNIANFRDSNCKLSLIVCCDGVFDHKTDEVNLANLLTERLSNETDRTKYDANPAEYLRNLASSFGSQDNITVCVTDISEAPTKPILIGVFDGHGGDKISNFAAKHFGKFLTNTNSKMIHQTTREDNSDEVSDYDKEKIIALNNAKNKEDGLFYHSYIQQGQKVETRIIKEKDEEGEEFYLTTSELSLIIELEAFDSASQNISDSLSEQLDHLKNIESNDDQFTAFPYGIFFVYKSKTYGRWKVGEIAVADEDDSIDLKISATAYESSTVYGEEGFGLEEEITTQIKDTFEKHYRENFNLNFAFNSQANEEKIKKSETSSGFYAVIALQNIKNSKYIWYGINAGDKHLEEHRLLSTHEQKAHHNSNAQTQFSPHDPLNFAYTDREINAVNNARNQRDGFTYWINESGKESGILKEGQSMLCDEVERIVVEMPACDTSGVNSPIAIRLKEQLDYLSDYENQNPEEFISYKILFPYNVGNNSHWNVGEIIFEENHDKQLEVTTTTYDPFGQINCFDEAIQKQIIDVFEDKYGKDRTTFFQSLQKSIQSVQTGVACGLYTAIALHNLKTKSEDEIWDGVFDESGNRKDEKTLREEDIELVSSHNPLSAANFCAQINEENFVYGRQDRQNLTEIEQKQLTEAIEALEQISDPTKLYKIFSAINNFLIGNDNDEEMSILIGNFQLALEETDIKQIFFKNELRKENEFKIDVCLLPLLEQLLFKKQFGIIIDDFSESIKQVAQSNSDERLLSKDSTTNNSIDYNEIFQALTQEAIESINRIKPIENRESLIDYLQNIANKVFKDVENEKILPLGVKRALLSDGESFPSKNPKIINPESLPLKEDTPNGKIQYNGKIQ